MKNGVVGFGKNHSKGWGFYLDGIRYGGYNVRETARIAYKNCKKEMFDLFLKYGCSDGQDEYKRLAKEFLRTSDVCPFCNR